MDSGYSNQYPRRLRVFLCHSSGDKPSVRKLYRRLVADGFDPWLDEENLIAGQQWQREIPKAVRSSDVVVVCLSHSSITKTGYIQKEIKFALDAADEQPEDAIFLVPLKLEECDAPERLSWVQWIDYFEERGHERLIKALKHRANALGINIEAPSIPEIILTKDQERSVATHSKKDAVQDEASTAQIDINAHKEKDEAEGTNRDRRLSVPEKQEVAPIASEPKDLLDSSLSDQVNNDKEKESDNSVEAKTNLQKQGGQTEATPSSHQTTAQHATKLSSSLILKPPNSTFNIKAKPIIVAVGVLTVIIVGALFLQIITNNTNNSNLTGNVAASPSPLVVASNSANTGTTLSTNMSSNNDLASIPSMNQSRTAFNNNQPTPSPITTLNTVNVRMRFASMGNHGLLPFDKRIEITVDAGGQIFKKWANSKGAVSFSNIPCGRNITVSLVDPDPDQGTGRVSKTLRLNCSVGVVNLGEFYIYRELKDGRLHNDAFDSP